MDTSRPTVSRAPAHGGAIVIGQCLGAGLHERARRALWTLLWVGGAIMTVFFVATLFARPIFSLFTDNSAFIERAEHALSILRWAGFPMAGWPALLRTAQP